MRPERCIQYGYPKRAVRIGERLLEAEWIRAAASGDDAAYQRLIETYREPVFRLAYLISGDANEAEDFVFSDARP